VWTPLIDSRLSASRAESIMSLLDALLHACKGNPHLTHQLTNPTDILMTDVPITIRPADFLTIRQADFLQFDRPTFYNSTGRLFDNSAGWLFAIRPADFLQFDRPTFWQFGRPTFYNSTGRLLHSTSPMDLDIFHFSLDTYLFFSPRMIFIYYFTYRTTPYFTFTYIYPLAARDPHSFLFGSLARCVVVYVVYYCLIN
jgi:hypothetical protein